MKIKDYIGVFDQGLHRAPREPQGHQSFRRLHESCMAVLILLAGA